MDNKNTKFNRQNQNITVYFQANALGLSADFAELHGYKNGYTIKDEAEFWNILGRYAEHQISKLKMIISANETTN